MKKSSSLLAVLLILGATIATAADEKTMQPKAITNSAAVEKCTKEADDAGLTTKAWRKFMVECVDKNKAPSAVRDGVKRCYKELGPPTKDNEWTAKMNMCLDSVPIEGRSKSAP